MPSRIQVSLKKMQARLQRGSEQDAIDRLVNGRQDIADR